MKRKMSIIITLVLLIASLSACRQAEVMDEANEENATEATMGTEGTVIEPTKPYGSGITPLDIYLATKERCKENNTGDISLLETKENAQEFTYFNNTIKVSCECSGNYVAKVMSTCADETMLQIAYSKGPQHVYSLLQIIAWPILELDHGLEEFSFIKTLLEAPKTVSDNTVLRICTIGDFQYALVVPDSDKYIAIVAIYRGEQENDDKTPPDTSSSTINRPSSDNAGGLAGSSSDSDSGNSSSTGDSISSGNANTACSHSYTDATCTKPKTCTKCGETAGGTLDHTWRHTTCTTPQKCSVCGEELLGSTPGHQWKGATCILPETCSVCNETQGSPLGHYVPLTKCTACDYMDYSIIAKTYSNITAYDSKTGESLTVTGVSVSGSGVLSFTFNGTSYSIIIKEKKYDAMTYFDCYQNGSKLSNAECRIGNASYYNMIHFEWDGVDGHRLYFCTKG